MNRIFKKIDNASLYLGYFSGALVLIMMIIIVIDVIKRHIFNAPTIWADEVSCYLLAGIALLGSAYTLTIDGHIRVEAITRIFNEHLRWYIELIGDILSLSFLLFFSWHACKFVLKSYSTEWISPTLLRTPLYVPQFFFTIGIVWFTVQFIVKILRIIILELKSNQTQATQKK